MNLEELMKNLPEGKQLLKNLPGGTQGWLIVALPYEDKPQAIKCATEAPAVVEAPPVAEAPAVAEQPAVAEAPERAPAERPIGCRCPDFSLDFNAGDSTCVQCASRKQCAAAMVR